MPGESWAVDRDVVIAVYQGPCRDGDFAANLEAARKVVRDARERSCDFLAFPETFLSGYDTPEHMRQGARTIDDPALQSFVRITT